MGEFEQTLGWLLEKLESGQITKADSQVLVKRLCVIHLPKKVDSQQLYELVGNTPIAKGIAAYRTGRYTEAIDSVKSHAAGPKKALSLLFQAMAFEKIGNHDTAIEKLVNCLPRRAQESERRRESAALLQR